MDRTLIINDSLEYYHNLIEERGGKRLIPVSCLFELTYRCNLSCIHCYVVRKKQKELDQKEIFSLLHQLKDVGCLYLILSGGEIFVRKDFFEIAKYASKLNFALILFTNGTLINEEVAGKLNTLKPLWIEISLYGFRDTHDRITRTKGSFDMTVKAIKLLSKKGIKVIAKSVAMDMNIEECYALRRFVEEELNVRWRGLAGLFIAPRNDGNKIPLSYRPTDEQIRDFLRNEIKIYNHNKNFKKACTFPEVNRDRKLCGAGSINCSVSPYGELNPCPSIRFKHNRLKGKSFRTIWTSHKDIRKLRALRVYDRKKCWDCRFISECVYCPGFILSETGSFIDKGPETCRIMKLKNEIYEDLAAKRNLEVSLKN